MENVVVTIFSVESEAYQAFNELSQRPVGTGYSVAEAALVKNENGNATLEDEFGMDSGGGHAAGGAIIGALVGMLGGPLGVLIGAGAGGFFGTSVDANREQDQMTAFEVLADKLYDGETAIFALVQEDEPAYNAAFDKYDTTILRYDGADIADEVERAKEVQEDLERQAYEQMREYRKAERAARREGHKAAIKARFEKDED